MTPDNALETLKTQRNQLLDQKRVLESRLEQLGDLLSKLDQILPFLEAFQKSYPINQTDLDNLANLHAKAKAVTKPNKAVPPKKRLSNPSKETVGEAARSLLEKSATPLSRKEIFEKLTDQGILIRGKNPEMVLSTMLWRVGEEYGIENRKGVGYVLQGKDYGMFG